MTTLATEIDAIMADVTGWTGSHAIGRRFLARLGIVREVHVHLAARHARVPVLVAGWGDPATLGRLADPDAPGTRFAPSAQETVHA